MSLHRSSSCAGSFQLIIFLLPPSSAIQHNFSQPSFFAVDLSACSQMPLFTLHDQRTLSFSYSCMSCTTLIHLSQFSWQSNIIFYIFPIQVAIMSVTVAPIRLILVVLFLLMVWPLAALAVAFRSEEDKLKPVTGWRL